MPLNSTCIKTSEINLKSQKNIKTKVHTCMQTIKWKIEELNKKNGVKCSIQGIVFILGKNGCYHNFLHVLKCGKKN